MNGETPCLIRTRRGSDQGEVKKTFQELVLEVNAVHLTDLNMDFWIEGAEALKTGGKRYVPR